jgi:apolipoprotein N-acyltransferase
VIERMRNRIGSERRALAAAVVSGVAVFMSFPAWDLFPLAFVALVPTLIAVERGGTRRALVLGTLMGWVTNLGGFYWITNLLQDYGYMPWFLASFLCALLALQQGLVWGVGFALGRWFRLRGTPFWLAYPAAMALSESIMPLIFPWHFGHSQYANIPLAQIAEIGGVVLISAVLVLTNSVIADVVETRRLQRGPVLGAVLLLLAAHGYGVVRTGQVDARVRAAETFEVGLVQANVGIYEKHDRAHQADQLLRHQRLSAELSEQGAELIVWPETAYEAPVYSYVPEGGGPAVRSPMLARFAERLPPSDAPLVESSADDDRLGTPPEDRAPPQRGFQVPVLTGAVMWSRRSEEAMAAAPPRGERPSPWDVHNAAFLLDAGGNVLGVYDKTMRMIFSEYVPGGRLLWRLTGINLYRILPMAGDFYGGQPTDGFVLPRGDGSEVRIGMMICYEDIMPSFGRAIHAGQPHFIVNVTNDAWFGDTSEPYLHLALAVFRTIEQRTSLVRSTNTGVSAIVDPVGRIVADTATFEQATLRYSVPLLEATTTPFMRLGNWPPLVLALFVLVCLIRYRGASRAT